MFEITIAPGTSIPMHSHPDHAVYIIEGGTLAVTDGKGMKSTMELKTGMGLILPGEQHSAVNSGQTTIKGVMVEVNRRSNKH